MQIRTGFGKKFAKKAGLVVLICGLAACTSIYRKHGYIPAQDELDNVMPLLGQANSTKVAADIDTLGSALDQYRLDNMA